MKPKAELSENDDDPLPWDARILRRIDPGIDPASIAENLRRTPAERLARLQEMLAFIERGEDPWTDSDRRRR